MEYVNAVQTLNEWFDKLNKLKFENTLSKPIISIASDHKNSCFGWCTTWQAWEADNIKRYEINIVPEHLNRQPQETIGTLLHEMVHLDNIQKGIKDCSRSGTYHNKKFKNTAEAHGLIVEPSQKYGYAHTKLTPETIKELQDIGILERIDLCRHSPVKLGKKSKSSTRKYVCPSCGISCRATKDIKILCYTCEEIMEKEETDTDE